MELQYVKAISAIVLFAVTIFAIMLPLFFFRRPRTPAEEIRRENNLRVISFISCFGAGVFLATCLLHLFPEVEELMDNIFSEVEIIPNYPVSEFLFGFGFLAILIIEQILLNFKEGSDVNNIFTAHQEQPAAASHSDEHSELIPGAVTSHYGTINPITQESQQEDVTFVSRSSSQSILRSFILLFALSLHSIFEGLAIGLQTTVKSDVRILIAVLIHKAIIAFTLGMKHSQSDLSVSSVVKSNLCFSLASPIGIFIGTVVMGFVQGLPMKITSGILQGLASGTFLYVTVFEILPQELQRCQDRLVKVGFVVFGYSVVSLLLTFLPE